MILNTKVFTAQDRAEIAPGFAIQGDPYIIDSTASRRQGASACATVRT
jgi:hypothetical protein